jgi:hypothetical protein
VKLTVDAEGGRVDVYERHVLVARLCRFCWRADAEDAEPPMPWDVERPSLDGDFAALGAAAEELRWVRAVAARALRSAQLSTRGAPEAAALAWLAETLALLSRAAGLVRLASDVLTLTPVEVRALVPLEWGDTPAGQVRARRVYGSALVCGHVDSSLGPSSGQWWDLRSGRPVAAGAMRQGDSSLSLWRIGESGRRHLAEAIRRRR